MKHNNALWALVWLIAFPLTSWAAPTTRCPLFSEKDIQELIDTAYPIVDFSWDRDGATEQITLTNGILTNEGGYVVCWPGSYP